MMWTYKGQPITVEETVNYYGFVYIIHNHSNGRSYIGRKYFTKASYKTVKGKRKKIRKASDWETYWGSNKVLIADIQAIGEHNFTREVLYLCKNRSECSYYETYEIFTRGALITENYYNEWVACKISKKNVIAK